MAANSPRMLNGLLVTNILFYIGNLTLSVCLEPHISGDSADIRSKEISLERSLLEQTF